MQAGKQRKKRRGKERKVMDSIWVFVYVKNGFGEHRVHFHHFHETRKKKKRERSK